MKKTLTSTGVGAVVGGTTYATIGGMGLALCGTAVGITLGPMIAIGAGVGLVGSVLHSLGKKDGREIAVWHTNMYD